MATSQDDGATFTTAPAVSGTPLDDREWIAAHGASTVLLSFHDATGQIDVLRSDDGGQSFQQISQAIPSGDYRVAQNQHGNLVVDHRTSAGTAPGGGQPGFWAYQSFVAPSDSGKSTENEAFVAVSNDGGYDWTDRPVPCSVTAVSTASGLAHNFPNVSVDPQGHLWYSWSDDHHVFAAESSDHGSTWTCSGPVSTTSQQAIFPWVVATSAGVDLVYYGTSGGQNPTWSVYFAQSPGDSVAGFGAPSSVAVVHQGPVCEDGATCTSDRQLLDDFGIDTDPSGWAHIAYSGDSPSLGAQGSYTGYAVQTGGTRAGAPNN